jgi:hypothetical protein
MNIKIPISPVADPMGSSTRGNTSHCSSWLHFSANAASTPVQKNHCNLINLIATRLKPIAHAIKMIVTIDQVCHPLELEPNVLFSG